MDRINTDNKINLERFLTLAFCLINSYIFLSFYFSFSPLIVVYSLVLGALTNLLKENLAFGLTPIIFLLQINNPVFIANQITKCIIISCFMIINYVLSRLSAEFIINSQSQQNIFLSNLEQDPVKADKIVGSSNSCKNTYECSICYEKINQKINFADTAIKNNTDNTTTKDYKARPLKVSDFHERFVICCDCKQKISSLPNDNPASKCHMTRKRINKFFTFSSSENGWKINNVESSTQPEPIFKFDLNPFKVFI